MTEPSGRLAVLDQDWEYALQQKPRRWSEVRLVDGRPVLRVVQRAGSPGVERDERYVVQPEQTTGRKLIDELAGRAAMSTSLSPSDLPACDILDSSHDESAQFTATTLAETVSSAGFRDIHVDRLTVWGQMLVLVAVRRGDRERSR